MKLINWISKFKTTLPQPLPREWKDKLETVENICNMYVWKGTASRI
jgi:hypothetical protein